MAKRSLALRLWLLAKFFVYMYCDYCGSTFYLRVLCNTNNIYTYIYIVYIYISVDLIQVRPLVNILTPE